MADMGYPLNQPVTISATFEVGGVPTDPTSVSLSIWSPSGVESTPTPTHPGVGVYSHVLALTVEGVWSYRFTGSGTAAGTVDGNVLCRQTAPIGYTYDLTTALGKVRFYTNDHDFSVIDPSVPQDQRSALFTDAELTMLLEMNGNSPLRATADALRALSNNRSLLVRSRKVGDTSVDYGDIRSELRKSADEFEALADKEDGGDQSPADAIVEQGWSDFAERRIVTNAWSRRP